EGIMGPVEQPAVPVGIFFFQLPHKRWSAPTTGLVDIPGQFDHRDRSEFSTPDKFIGCMIVCAAPSLRTYLNDPVRRLDCLQGIPVVFHRLGKRFFDISVATCFYRLY